MALGLAIVASSGAGAQNSALANIVYERVQTVILRQPDGLILTFDRFSPASRDFAVEVEPLGRQFLPNLSGLIPALLENLEFLEARPAGTWPASRSRASFRTFEGLVIFVESVETQDGVWSRLRAEAPAGTAFAASRAEAERLNARLQGLEFRLPEDRARLLMLRRSDIPVPR